MARKLTPEEQLYAADPGGSVDAVRLNNHKSIAKNKGKDIKRSIGNITKDEIIQTMIKSRGLTYLAAKSLGVSHAALDYRIKADPDLDSIVSDQRQQMLDTAETKLMEAMESGEKWAIEMILRTLGKNRGYVERQETANISTVRLEVVEEIIDARKAPEVMISVAKAGTPVVQLGQATSAMRYEPANLPEGFEDAAETGGCGDSEEGYSQK